VITAASKQRMTIANRILRRCSYFAPEGSSRLAFYLSELFIEVNLVFSFVPIPFTLAMITRAIPAPSSAGFVFQKLCKKLHGSIPRLLASRSHSPDKLRND
jgi:hypothetical protein